MSWPFWQRNSGPIEADSDGEGRPASGGEGSLLLTPGLHAGEHHCAENHEATQERSAWRVVIPTEDRETTAEGGNSDWADGGDERSHLGLLR